MSRSFATEAHAGRPRILFVGLGESSHTHSWIDLLEGAKLNVRLFATSAGVPPDEWPVRTYVTAYDHGEMNAAKRVCLHSSSRPLRFAKRNAARARGVALEEMTARWLAEVVRAWKPDIVHALGLDAASFYLDVRGRFELEGIGKLVLQTRGGSDLALAHFDPNMSARISEAMRACDLLLCDNLENFRIARALGISEEKFASIAPIPGTGGIDVDSLASRWHGAPSFRRAIVWPKAYECPWSKALPIYEALKICWERIQPCEIEMLALDAEARAWHWTLPAHIREHCHTHGRVPRARALELMTQARVMLAPSLVDGVPNSLYEAMAAGAFPVVSPLDTIRPVVEDETNVLFARNLYPEEIASALVRAMTDDALVDAAAERNLALVRRIADRGEIRARVINFYEKLAGE